MTVNKHPPGNPAPGSNAGDDELGVRKDCPGFRADGSFSTEADKGQPSGAHRKLDGSYQSCQPGQIACRNDAF
jgi:hypothetical protein